VAIGQRLEECGLKLNLQKSAMYCKDIVAQAHAAQAVYLSWLTPSAAQSEESRMEAV